MIEHRYGSVQIFRLKPTKIGSLQYDSRYVWNILLSAQKCIGIPRDYQLLPEVK